MIISNNVTEIALGLESKIIQINLSQERYFDKKKNERNIHDRLYLNTRRLQEKNGFVFLRIKFMLNLQYNGAAQGVKATREERLVLIVS